MTTSSSSGCRRTGLISSINIVLIGTMLLGGTPVFATHDGGTANGVCMVERFNATKPASVDALNCTSNDVSLAVYHVFTGPSSCIAGEVIDVSLKGDFIATAAERWDVGVFISQDGGTPNSLLTGDDPSMCYSDYLHPVSATNEDLDFFCDDGVTPCNNLADPTQPDDGLCTGIGNGMCSMVSSGFGMYYNGEITEDPGDLCGDILQDMDATFVTSEMSIVCQDSNGDGIADVQSCTVWANQRSNGGDKPSCIDEADVTAETTAKCTCEPVNIVGIVVREEAQIEVVKDLIPSGDSGLFNLQIDGADVVTDVGDGGTTGAVTVGAGDSGNPGDTHTVGEIAGTDTSLAAYTTSISCVDRGETTFNGGPALTQTGAGPLSVSVDPDDDIVCTITNQNTCSQAVCNPDACATYACDPAGAVNNCDVVTYTPGVVCYEGGNDICDPDVVCVDQQNTCPDPAPASAGTVCDPTVADICDAPDVCDGAGACVPTFAPDTTECRGDAGACDVAEFCDGAGVCPADGFEPSGTLCGEAGDGVCDLQDTCDDSGACIDNVAGTDVVCRADAGECDVADYCDGAGACDPDGFEPAGALCGNPGDGVCDVQDSCDGSGACIDNVEPATTICREDAGECDVADYCDGAGACDPDAFEPSGTLCGEAGDGVCDLQDTCDDSGACVDNVEPATTECRADAGECDVADFCDGAGACDPDAHEPSGTFCGEAGDGVCDLQDTCDGANNCVDNVEPATTICRDDTGECDIADYCDGAGACDPDAFEPAGTVCGAPGDALCDLQDTCDGANNCVDNVEPTTTMCRDAADACDLPDYCDGAGDCPVFDAVAPAGTLCRDSVTGDVICDPPEYCDGVNVECPGQWDDNLAPAGEPCGSQQTTACTDPDTCDGDGFCDNNNKVCGSVTDSALCEFDMEPTKGTCTGGSEDGSACYVDDPCMQGGGSCEEDGDTGLFVCLGGTLNGAGCTVPTTDPCQSGGGICYEGTCSGGSYDGTACCFAGGGFCEQSDQFRLLFGPDVQNWKAYRANSTNPGQTFYNIIYDASGAVADVTLTVTVPYPYVTVGGRPLHVYDDVALDQADCYVPGEALLSEPMFITLDDWINGADGTGAYNLTCDEVPGPGGSGNCTFEVTVPNELLPDTGLIYVNVHLDYGLKGPHVDANPADWIEDRYDKDAYISPWNSADALENTSTDDGPVAIADCTAYWFDHTDDVTAGVCIGGAAGGSICTVGESPSACTAGGGDCVATPLFEDSVENLNVFKQISGVFGRAYCSDTGAGGVYYLRLIKPDGTVAESIATDDEGYYLFAYRHKGKPAYYTVELYADGSYSTPLASDTVEMRGNGWYDVQFFRNCAGSAGWDSTVTYGSGKRRKGGED